METLLNPNLAYLLLAGGLFFAILAMLSPGTGLLEIGALFTLLLAGWSAYSISLPINYWAPFVLIIGVILFILSIRKTGQWLLLACSLIVLMIGSAYLFRGTEWWLPAVNPILAAFVSILSGGFSWLAARKALEARNAAPTHNLQSLIGKLGEAKTAIHQEGSVQVGSELWSAFSDQQIPSGTMVRVVERQGFILKVEAIETTQP